MKRENNYDILLEDALHSSDNAMLSTSTRKRTNKVVHQSRRRCVVNF
jgi:hypothetical protein